MHRRFFPVYILTFVLAFVLHGKSAGAEYVETTPVKALSGILGYGENNECIQDPGAQAGVYVYAGTSVPYEAPWKNTLLPDSLSPIFVSHAGRHGARFLSSPKYTQAIVKYLENCGELTPVGKKALRLCQLIDSVTNGRWGQLDSLGIAEQAGIGRRFAERYAELLERNDSINAIASYVPRCIMSMDAMTHAIAVRDTKVELATGSGRRYSPIVRGFESYPPYLEYKRIGKYREILDAFQDTVMPAAVVLRLSERGANLLEKICNDLLKRGIDNSGASLETALADTLAGEWSDEWRDAAGIGKNHTIKLARDLYKTVAGCEAINENYAIDALSDWRLYFTSMEYYDLWQCENLTHYFEFSDNALSEAPMNTAKRIYDDMMKSIEMASRPEYDGPAAELRFGHAETMMPLLALMDIPGCRYVTKDWNEVSANWQDWQVASMAVNLQLVLCRNRNNGKLYLLTYVNEVLVRQLEY